MYKLNIMSKTSKLLIGMLGAAAAGVIVGLLVAPDKGSETRKKLSAKAEDLKGYVEGLIKAGKDNLDDMAQTITEEVESIKVS